jgi:ferric-dicitrate binding protein FerR (iron transport regulator)
VSSDSDRLGTATSIWLARLERGLQAQEGAQLREWLQVPAQRDAIVEAAKLYHDPDIVAILAEMVPVGFGTPAPKLRRRSYPVNTFFAVCICSLAAGPIFLIHRAAQTVVSRAAGGDAPRPQDPPLPWGEEGYSTKFGQTRAVNLPDGSRLTLNGNTRVGILFGVGSRVATLQYGEALFDVERPRERPFQVDAGGRHFLAPQSRFDVRVIDPQTVELTVLEGGVTIRGLPWRWPTTPAEARMFDPQVFADTVVGPMQTVLLQASTMSKFALTAANARTRLSWEPQEVLYVTP